jgi:hypothetical protein
VKKDCAVKGIPSFSTLGCQIVYIYLFPHWFHKDVDGFYYHVTSILLYETDAISSNKLEGQ